jgi:ribosomal protein S18 acetylase RimI-like enzyme
MAISIPATSTGDGLRPVDMSRDLPQIVELLKMVFGESLEGDDRQLLGDHSYGPVNDLLYRFNPAATRLSNGFVWQADGRVVGNATLLTTRTWDRYLVANVAVHPSYRREGIARSLMHAVASAVRTRGGRIILLQVVKDNQPAIDLYRSLGYVPIGNMATWYATASRVRRIEPRVAEESDPAIEPLSGRRWREAYELDTANVHADLNWPEPLRPDAYRRTFLQRAFDFMNGRQIETWATTDSQKHLTGLATIAGEWGRSHLISLRVHPEWAGRLERPLLAKVIRRLYYLPRRNVRIDHPEADELTSRLLQEANFSVQRTLTHMRLDLSR